MKKNFWKVAAVLACAMAFTACGDNDDDAKKCDDKNPCAANEICQADGKCVAVECTLDKKCTDAAKICSDDNKCVVKTDKLECSKNQKCAEGHNCVAGICKADDVVEAECSLEKACKDEKDICNDDGKCVAKTDKLECGKNTLCADDKECKDNVCKDIVCSLTVNCPADKNLLCNDDGICVKETDKYNCSENAPCLENQKCEANLCKDIACDKDNPCTGDGYVCNDDAVCVMSDIFECGKYLDCVDDSKKCSTDNRCVECLSEADCDGKSCSDAGVCIECSIHEDCEKNTDGRTVCGENNKCVSDGVFEECEDCDGEGKLCIGGVHCVDAVKVGDDCNAESFVNRCADGALSRAAIVCEGGKVVSKNCISETYCFVSVAGVAECVSQCQSPLTVGSVEFADCDADSLYEYICQVPYKDSGALVSFEKITDCALESKTCGGKPASCIAK